MTLEVRFDLNDGTKAKQMLAEAEIHFSDAGPFDGLKLVGFSVWASVRPWESDQETYVTLPARAWGIGRERRYFDYVRSIKGDHREVDRLRDFVLAAWRDRGGK